MQGKLVDLRQSGGTLHNSLHPVLWDFVHMRGKLVDILGQI